MKKIVALLIAALMLLGCASALADGYEIITFAAEHFPALDAVFAQYAIE